MSGGRALRIGSRQLKPGEAHLDRLYTYEYTYGYKYEHTCKYVYVYAYVYEAGEAYLDRLYTYEYKRSIRMSTSVSKYAYTHAYGDEYKSAVASVAC